MMAFNSSSVQKRFGSIGTNGKRSDDKKQPGLSFMLS